MKIKCNCFLFDKKREELGLKPQDIPAEIIFDSSQISYVREVIDDKTDEICKNSCMVGLKCGESFLIDISYAELIKQI